MKSTQISGLLDQFAEIISGADSTATGDIRSLAGALDRFGQKSVKAVMTAYFPNVGADLPSETESALQRLSGLLELAGAREARKDILLLLAAVFFTGSIQTLVEKLKPVQQPTNVGQADRQKPRMDIVRSYLDELYRFQDNNEEFDRTIARLSADRSFRKQEALELCSQYLGFSPKASETKERILQRVIDRQALENRQGARKQPQAAQPATQV